MTYDLTVTCDRCGESCAPASLTAEHVYCEHCQHSACLTCGEVTPLGSMWCAGCLKATSVREDFDYTLTCSTTSVVRAALALRKAGDLADVLDGFDGIFWCCENDYLVTQFARASEREARTNTLRAAALAILEVAGGAR